MKGWQNITIIILMLAWLLPFFQNITGLFSEHKLAGDFFSTPKPEFESESWFNYSFQEKFNEYTEQNIGFRSFFVRVNNQLDYSLFNELHAEGVVKGTGDHFLEYDYIRAYLGRDFIGKAILDKKSRRTKFVQEKLRQKNTDLVVVFAPGKASVYPEQIPSEYEPENRTVSNRDHLLRNFDLLGIRYIDFTKWFKEIRDTSKYPVFPEAGTHWSEYGAFLAADSLLSYIEKSTQYDVGSIKQTSVRLGDPLQSSDYDIGIALNLLFTLPHSEMAYPNFIVSKNKSTPKPKVLTIGDSFYWNIFNMRAQDSLFQDHKFWYYNDRVYPDFYLDSLTTDKIKTTEEIEKQDVVFIIITERFLHKFAWRFIDQLYEAYNPGYEKDELYNHTASLLNVDQWFNQTLEQADKKKISLEQALLQNAEFMFLENDTLGYIKTFGPAYYERVIREDSTWIANIKNESGDKGIDFDVLLKGHAEYMFSQEYPELFNRYLKIEEYKSFVMKDSAALAEINRKASVNFLSFEEMLHQDAVWIYNNTPD